MTFNQIKYFITVAEALSFTEAAKCLFLTQPALSRQISALEQELGITLFLREKKQLKLTPGGAILYNWLPRMMDEFSDVLYQAQTANQGFEGSLHIGILDVYDVAWILPAVILEFQEKYSNIQVSMERFSLGELPKRLNDGSLDLILTYGFSLFDQPNLMTVNIQKYDSCIMLSRHHPLADKPDLTLTDLRNEPFVSLGRHVCEKGYDYIKNLCSRCGINPVFKQVDKMQDVLLWVETGNYAAITSNRTIESQNPSVVIREIPINEAHDHDVTMGWCKSNYNPAIAFFMELLESHLNSSISRSSF